MARFTTVNAAWDSFVAEALSSDDGSDAAKPFFVAGMMAALELMTCRVALDQDGYDELLELIRDVDALVEFAGGSLREH